MGMQAAAEAASEAAEIERMLGKGVGAAPRGSFDSGVAKLRGLLVLRDTGWSRMVVMRSDLPVVAGAS